MESGKRSVAGIVFSGSIGKRIMVLFRKIKKAVLFFLDALFPIECVSCGEDGEFLCRACIASIRRYNAFFCPLCGKSSSLGRVCVACGRHSFLDGAWIAADYNQPVLERAIKCYKYSSIRGLFQPLGDIFVRYLETQKLHGDFHMVIPVPLHKRKERMRGFNQSQLLAEQIGKYLSLPVETGILERRRYTRPQVRLSINNRKKNVSGAFIVRDPQVVAGKRILLVDDVLTTGNTLNECARVLRGSGAQSVWGCILAKKFSLF